MRKIGVALDILRSVSISEQKKSFYSKWFWRNTALTSGNGPYRLSDEYLWLSSAVCLSVTVNNQEDYLCGKF